jgi:hypothetical protein
MSANIVTRKEGGFGAFCRYCGDYLMVDERIEAITVEQKGCARCKHFGPHGGIARGVTMELNAIIYDIEIEKAIPDRDGLNLEAGVEYCDGWKDFKNMGISVIGVYDYVEDRLLHYLKPQLQEFAALVARRDLVIGFNNRSFDDQLLAANGITVPRAKSYDILVEIWAADGLGPAFNHRTHGGYGLDRVCAVNFGLNKTGSGDLAPVMWQRGQHQEVIDYCMNDVALTREIMDRILRGEPIRNPKRSYQNLTIRKPERRNGTTESAE